MQYNPKPVNNCNFYDIQYNPKPIVTFIADYLNVDIISVAGENNFSV